MKTFAIIFVISLTTSITETECDTCVYSGPAGSTTIINCAPNQKCCPYGCCRSRSFQVHQLWYIGCLIFLITTICCMGYFCYRRRNMDPHFSQRPMARYNRPTHPNQQRPPTSPNNQDTQQDRLDAPILGLGNNNPAACDNVHSPPPAYVGPPNYDSIQHKIQGDKNF